MKAVEKEKPPVFPFSALVGQELMKTALILNAVDPGIGGVLIRGQKGTGKTTAVRSLQAVLPPLTVVTGCPYHCSPQDPAQMHRECRERFEAGESLPVESIPTPLVNLPLNATEDRIVGTLQLEEALSRGVRKFEPGLLASAHRGILYIDEVNLLDDHLVDLLLDAAATGINTVEREGVSYSHPSRFMLIGTMNPEEGELRPQFLDRFGLCVHVATLPSREERREIVKRRIQFEEDPRGFIDQWKEQEELLSRCIFEARERIASYKAGEEILDAIVRIAEEAGAVGHRAEIILLKAARALAAFTAVPEIRWEHIQEVARIVLPHRIALGPFQDPDKVMERINTLTEGESPGTGPHEGERDPDETGTYEEEYGVDPTVLEEIQVPGSAAAGSILFEFLKKKLIPS